MKARKTIVPAGLEAVYANWHFAPAAVSNGMIYCSGIIGTSPGGEASDDSEAGAFEGARSILRDTRATLSDLKAVTDPEQQFVTAFEALRSVLAGREQNLAMSSNW